MNGKLIFLIIILLTVLGAGGWVGYSYLNKPEPKPVAEVVKTPDEVIEDTKTEVKPEIFEQTSVSDPCEFSFTLAAITTPTPPPTPPFTPTPPPTATPTPTPRPTPPPSCYEPCVVNSDGTDQCPIGLECQMQNLSYVCVNPLCPATSTCVCVTPPPTPTPTPTPTLTPTSTPTPTPTTQPKCYETCAKDQECPNDLICKDISGTKRCVNPGCIEDNDCVCNPPQYPEVPELPKAGGLPPTLIFAVGGIIIVALGLLF